MASNNNIFQLADDSMVPAIVDNFFKASVGYYYNVMGLVMILLLLIVVHQFWMGKEGYGNANLSGMIGGKYMFDEPSAGFEGKCDKQQKLGDYLEQQIKDAPEDKEAFSDKSLQAKLY